MMGTNNQVAQSLLKQYYKDEITKENAVHLVLRKTMDNTILTSEKFELAKVFLSSSGDVNYCVCSLENLRKLLATFVTPLN